MVGGADALAVWVRQHTLNYCYLIGHDDNYVDMSMFKICTLANA
jgi:hypothetical protein